MFWIKVTSGWLLKAAAHPTAQREEEEGGRQAVPPRLTEDLNFYPTASKISTLCKRAAVKSFPRTTPSELFKKEKDDQQWIHSNTRP